MKLFVITICGFIFLAQFYELINEFTKHPATINTEIRFNIKETEIPSISLCYHYFLLIGKEELMKLDSNFNETKKEIRSQLNEFDSDGVKLENSWRSLRRILIKKGIDFNQIKNTFIQHPIKHCFLNNEFGHSIPCEQMTNVTITNDDKYQCFSLFRQSFKTRKSNPMKIKVPLKESIPFLRFYILFNDSNCLNPPRRVQLVINPPDHNPLDHISSSIELEMKSFQVAYSKTNVVLLPKPHQTKCIDYSGTTKYNSQLDCLTQCLTERSLKYCKCWPPSTQAVNLTQLDHVCWLVKPDQQNCTLKIESECQEICQSPDCMQEKYSFEIRSSHKRNRKSGIQWIQQLKRTTAKVVVLTPFNFETTFIHKPEYNLIQIICYVVSLLGFWYGISVISFYDFLSQKYKSFQRKTSRKTSRKTCAFVAWNNKSLYKFKY